MSITLAVLLAVALGMAPSSGSALAAPRVRSSDTFLSAMCLSHADSHCLAFGTNLDVELVDESALSVQTLIAWRTVGNQQGDTTYESEGMTTNWEEGEHLCLAAAATATNPPTNNRVYITSNCWGNPFASWICIANGNGCNLLNLYSLNNGYWYMLTALNTRFGAYLYVEPATAGTWQDWNWYGSWSCDSDC